MGFFLEKPATYRTPYVLINEDKRYMRIEGESFHESVIEVFADINIWLEKYLESDFDDFTLDCEMTYFNSSTAKLLFNILLSLDECAARGKAVTVNWITSKDNDIIIECGEDLEDEMTNLNFNLVVK
jgi:hypothetical protein